MQLNYNSEIIQIHIERSKRKTMSMYVNKDGSVTVKAPHLFPTDKEILTFIEQKIDWILKQRNRQQEREDMKLVRRFETDYSFPYLGKERLIEMQFGKKNSISYENEKIILKTPHYENLKQNYDAPENAVIIENEH